MNEQGSDFIKYAKGLILFVLLLSGCSGDGGTTFEDTQVTTLGGTGTFGSTDGTGTAASFFAPFDITSDGTNLYVADTFNRKIRKIVIATGVVTTLAGSGAIGSTNATGAAATFNGPYGIATDNTNLYVADSNNNLIRQIVIATGVVTTIAGSGISGSANGTGTAATFNGPYGIATDNTNLFVSETGNQKIRQIVIATGEVTTLAGSGIAGSSDGTGVTAAFNDPQGVATDGTNLYVADTSNLRIRQIVIATGEVTTFAGSGAFGSIDGNGTAASFNRPLGIATDGVNLYVGDSFNHRIRKIVISSREVTTLAGSGITGSADGAGFAASFHRPAGITSVGGIQYVADTSNHLIRQIQ